MRSHASLPLGFRLAGLMAVFGLLVVGITATTYWVTETQKADGVTINLAGRQRMLTQKMTKATLGFVSEKQAAAFARQSGGRVRSAEEHQAEARAAKQLFASTLTALFDGGEASFGKKRPVLPACKDETTRAQLMQVQELWGPFEQALDQVLASSSISGERTATALNHPQRCIATANFRCLSC